MDWRWVAFIIILCADGWLSADILSSPSWVQLLYYPVSLAFFAAGIMYVLDPHWGRKYPRLHKRMTLGGALLTLVVVVLFLLFGEPFLEGVIGQGYRPILFLVYLFLFVGATLFVQRVIAGKWRRW